jgi:hypothetical protein
MVVFETLRKVKRLRLFEPSLVVVGFFLVLGFTTCCFLYLDFREFGERFGFSGQFKRFTWSTEQEHSRVDFLDEKGDKCDLFEGNWIWDEKYPLYESKDCKFLDFGFRCSENGRPDLFYTKWRWQPKDCNLPRYNATHSNHN